MKVIYEGFFIESCSESLKSTLEKNVGMKHITSEFKPSVTHEHLYGERASFIVTGYGNDEENEGYSVEMMPHDNIPQELYDIYKNIKNPHITTSTSLTGKPVKTSGLAFTECQPIIIKCRFGGFTGGGVVYE